MADKDKGYALQAEFADKRKRALNKRDQEKIDRVIAAIAKLAKKDNILLDKLATRDTPGWEVVYGIIINKLQNANLTINLSADSWFAGGPNTYKTYATTYQKHVAAPGAKALEGADNPGNKSILKTQYKADGLVSEDARQRLFSDQKVTLPDKWKKRNLLHPQRRRLYKAMSTHDANAMGDLAEVELGDGKVGYQIDNRHFNPYTKQVFAALNYGERPHGASINYGYSHLILKPEMKRKAIYFPGDTFSVAMATNAASRQCTFETLGAVLAYCQIDMGADIWQSCYRRQACVDSGRASLLLEAHIFQEVKLDQHVQALCLSRSVKDGELASDVWDTVKTNATSWCKENNVRLIMQSA